jgi:uncharacterized membrane protein required for colicin V production
MLLDIFLGIPIIIFTLLGWRDGIIRKLVACIALFAGLILGQIFMHDVGEILVETANISSSNASMYGFLIIFVGIAILQGLLYKILAGSYKIGGLADRLGGVVVGFIEGALFLSTLLLIFAFAGIPSRETAQSSSLYKSIVNIAPQALDFTSTAGPETLDKIKNIGSDNTETKDAVEEKSVLQQTVDTSAVLNEKKQHELINSVRKTARK